VQSIPSTGQQKAESTVMEYDVTSLFAFIAAFILLAVTSVRFGVDSREGTTPDGSRVRRGIV
jgi:hypothetical protein